MIDLTLTTEQQLFATHGHEVVVEACPGAGKTRTVVARLAHISKSMPARKGVALLSFTNSAVEEFIRWSRVAGLEEMLKHPGFVGTFDSFLRHFFIAPVGIAGVNIRPIVVDSWDSLDIEVRLSGRNAFHGPGVSLDSFAVVNNQILPDLIGHSGLRAHVAANQAAYRDAAELRRRNLRQNGYLSAADARVEARGRLEDENWSRCLGRALAARFQEVIVDEAQDCNPLDLEILQWLRNHGLPVVVVSDADQAIYGFRHGDPANLRGFSETYSTANRLSLTGNFRSSPPICVLASTLRTRRAPDVSTGVYAAVGIPVQVIGYDGQSVPSSVGTRFSNLVVHYGVDPVDGIVLAHSRRAACRATGFILESDNGGNSKIAMLTREIGVFWSPSASNRTRENVLRTIERILLELMGKIESGESPSRAAEKHGLDRRWLRRTALELIVRLPRLCGDSDAERASWIATLHGEVDRLRLQYAQNVSARRYFRSPSNAKWSRHLRQSDNPRLRWATIHEAKGRQYGAVCVVIPPDRGNTNHTARLFDAWENRIDEEAKRVIYVGVTRAEKLVAIAIPTAFRQRLASILNGAGVRFKIS